MSMKGQPKALKVFFMTELWERFACYAVQSLLVLFMKSKLNMSDSQSYMIFGALGALLYVTPVIGGYVADRFIGYKNAVTFGGVFLAIGYFLLATGGVAWFYFSLACLVAGNGFFKPNVSAAVGDLYEANDPRRDSGFTMFYMGINVGSFLGVVLCGYIRDALGFDISFFICAIGLLLGVATFLIGLRRFPALREKITQKMTSKKLIVITVLSVIGVIVTDQLIKRPDLTNILLAIAGILLIAYIITSAVRLEKLARNKLIVCMVLMIFSIAFFALYQQMPMSLTLFINRLVDRNVLGITIPTSSFWAFNAVAIILLTPLFLFSWKSLYRVDKEPSTSMKFVLGIVFMGAGFLVLVLAILLTQQNQMISAWWVILSYFVQTAGELALSPIGLAMVTALAPPKMRGLMMGAWFFAIATSTAIAGSIAKFASIPQNVTSISATETIYLHAFLKFSAVTLAVGVILFFLVPKLERAIKED